MLGLLYDVHGNRPALEAVLADAADTGVRSWIVGGDVALFGAWPEWCVQRLRDLEPARWVRGNGERWLVENPEGNPAGTAAVDCVAALGASEAVDLAALPFAIRDGERMFVHAGCVDDMHSFLPSPGDDEAEQLAAIPKGVGTLVFGHTHLAFAREARGVRLVNPGSVGMPLDGDRRAAWAILHDDGRVEHRRVDYDVEAAATALESRFGDVEWTQVIRRRVLEARA